VEKVINQNSKYGIRRIKADLEQKYQIIIGRDVLGKLLEIWGLSLKRKIKKSKPSMLKKILQKLADKTNILIKSVITNPFQAVTSDITELYCQEGKFYLCVHKDYFGQMIYGYSIAQKMDLSLAKVSLLMAVKNIRKLTKIKSIKELRLIFHQDQGSQYTSYEYIQNILNYGRVSFSTPGTPTENPGQESFFGRFKNEWKDEILELKNFNQAKKFVIKKLLYYNNKRIHTSIGYMPPKVFTKKYLKSHLEMVGE
jgi:putative transposase